MALLAAGFVESRRTDHGNEAVPDPGGDAAPGNDPAAVRAHSPWLSCIRLSRMQAVRPGMYIAGTSAASRVAPVAGRRHPSTARGEGTDSRRFQGGLSWTKFVKPSRSAASRQRP